MEFYPLSFEVALGEESDSGHASHLNWIPRDAHSTETVTLATLSYSGL